MGQDLEHKHLDVFIQRDEDGLLHVSVKTLKDRAGFVEIKEFEGGEARDVVRLLTDK